MIVRGRTASDHGTGAAHPWPDPVVGDRQDRRNPDDEYTGVAPDDLGPTVNLDAIMFPRTPPGYGPGGYE